MFKMNKKTVVVNTMLLVVFAFVFFQVTIAAPIERQVYEWRVYTLSEDGEEKLDNFFEKTVIPTFSKMGVKVGVFAPINNADVEKQIYALFIYPNINSYYDLKTSIWNNDDFMKTAKPFYDSVSVDRVYENIEVSICMAFASEPVAQLPSSEKRFFEYRRYQLSNEEAMQRKKHMFEHGESDIFKKYGVNVVCFGEVLAGGVTPSIIYLTCFENLETRNKRMSAFSSSSEFANLRSVDYYTNLSTRNTVVQMIAKSYSQI